MFLEQPMLLRNLLQGGTFARVTAMQLKGLSTPRSLAPVAPHSGTGCSSSASSTKSGNP